MIDNLKGQCCVLAVALAEEDQCRPQLTLNRMRRKINSAPTSQHQAAAAA